nr:uncharacterized protein LOC129384329 [Dermacentor andersoni]
MEVTARVVLALVVVLLAAVPSSVTAADADTCSDPRTLVFTKVPAANPTSRAEVTRSAVVQLFVGMHRILSGMLFSGDMPEAANKGGKLDAQLAIGLLLGGTGVVLLVASVILAVLVPLIGLVVLCVRCLRPSADQEPETEEQAASRAKWSLRFWVLIASLAFMVFGALLTKGHASVALDGIQNQGRFLADAIPGVFHGPINDLGVIAGPNFREFLSALDQRFDDCTEKAATTAENAIASNPLLKFASTAAEHLLQINKLIETTKEVAYSADVSEVHRSIRNASTSLGDALAACSGSCESIKPNLEDMRGKVQGFLASRADVPHRANVLSRKLTYGNLSRHLAQIPRQEKIGKDFRKQTKESKAKLRQYGARFVKSVGELNDSVKRSVEEAQKAVLSLDNMPDDVATGLGIYGMVVTVVAVVISIIVALYLLGNQCSMWRAPRGWCSFNAASWAMTVAAFAFILFFPLFVIVSTLGMATGMAADRRLCVPAQDLGAPGSRSFVEFVASRLGSKEADRGSAALHEDDTETHALRIASRQRRGGVASSKPRHLVASSGSPSSRRRRATLASSKRRHGAKHPASGHGFARKTAGRFESLERRESRSAPQARTRRRRRQQRDGDIGGFEPPADLPSALQKEFTPKAVKGMLERFAQCSRSKLPLVKLLGKDMVTNLAKVILGKKSPWLGLVEDTAGAPKLEALDKLGSQWTGLNVGKDVKKELKLIAEEPIDATLFQNISTAARRAKSDFANFENTKADAQGYLSKAGTAATSLQEMITALDKALQRKAAFENQMDIIVKAEQELAKAATVEGQSLDAWIKENVAKWSSMEAGMQGASDRVLAVAAKAKTGLKSDVTQFYEHAKEQIQEHIGDCRPFYVLYISTVNTACDHGVRLLAAYWSSVWWFMVLGVPSVVVALMLSAHFARATVQAEVTKDSLVQKTNPTEPASVAAVAVPPVNPADPGRATGT